MLRTASVPARPAFVRAGLAACLALALGACAQNQLGGVPTSRAAIGAATGAALDAGAGLLVGDEHQRRDALIGAGVGAIAGAAVGTYLDRQTEALREDLAGTGATVTNTGEQLVVTLPQDVTFATESSQIASAFQPQLRELAATLRQYPESAVDVVGHTDDTGEAAYNQALSERRARAVAAALQENGVQAARIAAYGYGETQPVATNATPEGRARNRRVEIVVTPLTQGV